MFREADIVVLPLLFGILVFMDRKAKGVIFDMDGVLFDTERIFQGFWKDIAEERGVDLGEDFVSTITGTNGKLLLSIVERYYHVDDGRDIRDEVIRRIDDYLTREVPIKKGVINMLSYLKEKGIRTAIASSSPTDLIISNLKVSGTTDYFDIIVSGKEVEKGKPSPDIFLLAASRLDLDCKDCIIFEDSFNGIRAAHSSGAITIMIPDLIQPTEEIKALTDGIYQDFDAFLEDKDKYF